MNMFIKKGSSILIAIISFLIGVVICYLCCQTYLLEIDYKLNVVDSIFSVAGLGIGLYIALIFENQKSRGQNFYSYVEGKFDLLWQDFIQLNEVLDNASQTQISELSRSFKKIEQKISPLKKIFEASDYKSDCISEIEGKIESLEIFLSTGNHISNNIVNLIAIRVELTEKLNDINETFAKSYKKLNKIS